MRRVLNELGGPRRLRPGDPEGEIAILRALAMALTAAAGRNLSLEDVQAALRRALPDPGGQRFRGILPGGPRDGHVGGRGADPARHQRAGRRQQAAAARWIHACLTALKFEKEVRFGPDLAGGQAGPARRPAARRRRAAGLHEADQAAIVERIGDIGGQIEADAKLVAMVAKAGRLPGHRLQLLLRLAAGETAPSARPPIGPAPKPCAWPAPPSCGRTRRLPAAMEKLEGDDGVQQRSGLMKSFRRGFFKSTPGVMTLAGGPLPFPNQCDER